MQIHTTCRHTTLTPALKRLLDERLAKLEKFSAIREAHVVLEAEKYRQIAEVVLKIRGKELVCREESRDMATSIEAAVSRLERQLKKLKEKRTTRKLHDGTRTNGDEALGAVRSAARVAIHQGEGGDGSVVKAPSRKAARVASARAADGTGPGPAIVAGAPHPKPLSLEEATLELTANGHEFLAFVNAETEELNVLYRRKDGDLGWIERGGRRRSRG